MATVSVTKCHGTGNDFLILDRRSGSELNYAEIARALCPRRFSVGADGLLVLQDPADPTSDIGMRIFNPDGSEAAMCGNGIRCVARYLYEENPEAAESVIETAAGRRQTAIVTWQGRSGARVAMGEPVFAGGADGRLDHAAHLGAELAPAYAVSMGNPHVVLFATGDVGENELVQAAAIVASWKVFPSEPNVEVVRVAGNELFMRVHERGAGETWACGTGACAAAAAAIASKRTASPVTVTTKGGSVRVSWDGPGHPAFLTGNAELIFHADVEIESAQDVGATAAPTHR